MLWLLDGDETIERWGGHVEDSCDSLEMDSWGHSGSGGSGEKWSDFQFESRADNFLSGFDMVSKIEKGGNPRLR